MIQQEAINRVLTGLLSLDASADLDQMRAIAEMLVSRTDSPAAVSGSIEGLAAWMCAQQAGFRGPRGARILAKVQWIASSSGEQIARELGQLLPRLHADMVAHHSDPEGRGEYQ
jgi:hypothetical protein